jgi:hypothetical protein
MCPVCGSGNQSEFPSEMALHFSGLENLHKPHVMIFPKILLCLECGAARFTVPETELTSLANATSEAKSFAQSGR